MIDVAERVRLQRRGVLLKWFTVTWNVVEATVAITAGVVASSVALVGFGIDSGIELVAASALLWRFRKAGADASEEEHGAAERRALYIVSATFFVLAAYIAFEAVSALVSSEEPDTSNVGIVLAVISLVVMPTLAYCEATNGSSTRKPCAGSRCHRDVRLRLPVARAARWCRSARGVRLVVGRSRWSPRHAPRDSLAGLGDVRGGARRRLTTTLFPVP
jgi:Cation efflux family